MWIWSLFVALCMANVMVCTHQPSYYEAPWEKLGYRLVMDPIERQAPVYRKRIPRQVYYYEPRKGDQSLVAQKRIARSHSFVEPQYKPSKGDSSLVPQHRIVRSHSFIEPQYKPSKGDSSLVPQHRIARSHSFIEPQYKPSKGDSSLVPQHRIARSHSFVEPQYKPSKGDSSLVPQHRIGRSHSFIEPQYKPSKGDSSLVPQHRIGRSHSFIEPQYHYESSQGDQSLIAQKRIGRSHSFTEPYFESSKDDPSLVHQHRIGRSHSLTEPHYESSKDDPSLATQRRIARSHSFIKPQLLNSGEESELPPVYESDLHSIQSRLKKRIVLRSLAENDVEIKILDMDPLQLKEALILGLRSLAKRQEKLDPAISELYHEGVPAEPAELSKSSLYTDDNHENKVKESSENYKDPSDTVLKIEASNKSDEEYTDEIQDLHKNNAYQGDSVQQPLKSKKRGAEYGQSKEIYENPVQSNVNYDNYKLIKDNSVENHIEEYAKNKKSDLTRNVRSRNYQNYFDEPTHYKTETIPKGRNLEVSNFITPDKSSMNSIDYQNNIKNKQKYSTNNDYEINNYFDVLDNINQPNNLKDQSLIDNTAILLPPNEENPIMEAVTENSMIKNNVTEIEESSMQNALEKSNESPEFIADYLIEAIKYKNSKEDENQKVKKEHSNESKYFGRESKNKEEKNMLKLSNESGSESLENYSNSSEEIKSVKMKYIPPCPESMDPSFRVDENQGIICSSDDDCKGEGEYCCQAYINLNKCWYW